MRIPQKLREILARIKKSKKSCISISIAALLVIAATFYIMLFFQFNNTKYSSYTTNDIKTADNLTQSAQIQTIQGATITTVPLSITPTISDSNNVETYLDSNISFHHLQKDSYYTYTTKIDGNRKYVYPTYLSDYHEGSFIEIFKVNPSNTIQQDIQDTVLAGYNRSDCPIGNADTVGTLDSNTTTASIRYSQNNLYSIVEEPMDASKCPTDYTTTEGLKYFAINNKHPNLMVFYSVGNGGIPADTTGNTLWFQSIKFN